MVSLFTLAAHITLFEIRDSKKNNKHAQQNGLDSRASLVKYENGKSSIKRSTSSNYVDEMGSGHATNLRFFIARGPNLALLSYHVPRYRGLEKQMKSETKSLQDVLVPPPLSSPLLDANALVSPEEKTTPKMADIPSWYRA